MFDPFSFKIPDSGTVNGIPAGGSTGQVLTKINGTDYNVNWQTPIAQFNPSAGSNISLTGVYPNITFHAIGAPVNFLHNSHFDYNFGLTVGADSTATATSKICPRWCGFGYDAGNAAHVVDFISSATGIRINRITNNTTVGVLGQVFESLESGRFKNKIVTITAVLAGNNSDIGCRLRVVKLTTLTDQTSLKVLKNYDEYLSYFFSAPTSSTEISAVFDLSTFSNILISQIGFELRVDFGAAAGTRFVDVEAIYATIGSKEVVKDTKSMALVKTESNRCWQNVDAYLTTAFISIPISMRAIPTVTLTPNPASGFTTTGTTKETLIIQLNNAADNGLYSIDLMAEL